MYTLRTKFKNGIRAEFLPPIRKVKKTKVVIFCDGAPSVPSKKHLLEFFARKGFWAFHPRYRGSWESDGRFMEFSPHLDVLDVIDSLGDGFRDYWNHATYKLTPDQIILIGSSFGGAAVILASTDPRISHAFAFSPLINWLKPGPDEPIDKLEYLIAEAFGQGYRLSDNLGKKVLSGEFYNPINEVNSIAGNKLTLVHAKDDRICPYKQSQIFSKKTQSKLITLPRGGHLGMSEILKPRFWKMFQKIAK